MNIYANKNDNFIDNKKNPFYNLYNNINKTSIKEHYQELEPEPKPEPELELESITNNVLNDDSIRAMGKKVVLIDVDEPWYLNVSADRIPTRFRDNEPATNFNTLKYRDNADFNSVELLNPNKYNLGKGYSLLGHLQSLMTTEHFSNTESSYILIILIILTILLIVVSFRK